MATEIHETSVLEEPRLRTVHTRTQVLGLLTVLAGLLVILVAALIAGLVDGEFLSFFGVAMVVILGAATLVWRFGTWAKVVGILASLAAGFMFWWAAFGLAYPASVVDFLPGLLIPLGVIVGLVGGILGIVKRKQPAPAATAGERRTMQVVIAVGLIGLVVSGGLAMTSRSAVDPAVAAGAIQLEHTNFEFAPDAVTVAAGEQVRIVVKNNDPLVHTFSIEELGIDEVILPGNSELFEFTAAEGTYTIYCAPHAHKNDAGVWEGMVATLVVQ
jgi:plastocyanin